MQRVRRELTHLLFGSLRRSAITIAVIGVLALTGLLQLVVAAIVGAISALVVQLVLIVAGPLLLLALPILAVCWVIGVKPRKPKH